MRAYSTLILASVVGIFFLLMLTAWYNRPTADDLAYLADVKNLGIWDTAVFSFNTWNTRFTSILVSALGLKLYLYSNTLLFEQTLAYGLLIFGIYKLVDLKSLEALSKFEKLSLSACIFYAFFLITPSVSETWIWHISYSMYFLPLLASIWLFYLVLSPSVGIAYYSGLILVTAYLSMASEFWSILLILVLGFMLISKNVFPKIKSNHVKAFIGILLVGLMIMGLGVGSSLRAEHLPAFGWASFANAWMRGTASTLLKYILLKLPLIICLAVPFLVLGREYGTLPKHPGRTILIAITAWFLWVLINHAGLAYTLQESGPLRARAISAFAFVPLCFYLFWIWGTSLKEKDIKTKKWILMPSLIILFITISTISTTLSKHKNYAKAYDARMVLLENLNKEEGITEVYVVPLPHSGIIYSNDIQADSTDYRNKALKRYLNLNFQIMIK